MRSAPRSTSSAASTAASSCGARRGRQRHRRLRTPSHRNQGHARRGRQCGFRKIHVIFQPHRYTRTRDLMEEFTAAFHDADSLFVLDIYAASEQPIEGVTGERYWRKKSTKSGEEWANTGALRPRRSTPLLRSRKTADMILTLGAGSVSQFGPMLWKVETARVGSCPKLKLNPFRRKFHGCAFAVRPQFDCGFDFPFDHIVRAADSSRHEACAGSI